jgi:hypothetical protein
MTRTNWGCAAKIAAWTNWALLTCSTLFLFAGGVGAAATETRSFALSVDGKSAGDMQLRIAPAAQGTFHVSCRANVKVRQVVVVVYTYSFEGTETWQDQRLVRLQSTTNDNGKALTATAVAEGKNLRVTANGQERMSRPDVWTTTYWRLPDAKFRNGPVPLLDCDTGRSFAGRMEYVGANQISVAGQVQTCPHYRVTGDKLQVDLWYDAQERLVRQESIEDGHRTVFELVSLRHGER